MTASDNDDSVTPNDSDAVSSDRLSRSSEPLSEEADEQPERRSGRIFLIFIFLIIVVVVAIYYARAKDGWAERQLHTLTGGMSSVERTAQDEPSDDASGVQQPQTSVQSRLERFAARRSQREAEAASQNDVAAVPIDNDTSSAVEEGALLDQADNDASYGTDASQAQDASDAAAADGTADAENIITEMSAPQQNTQETQVPPQATALLIQERAENKRLQQALTEMAARLNEVENAADRQQQIARDFVNLRKAINSGQSFESEYLALMAYNELPDAIRSRLKYFEDIAPQGLMGEGELSLAFSSAIKRFYTEGMVLQHEKDRPGMWGQATRWLRSLVTIRKVGDSHTGDSDGSIIARAETQMNAGNVDKALQLVNQLSVHAGPYFKQWKKQAYRVVSSETLLNDVEPDVLYSSRSTQP